MFMVRSYRIAQSLAPSHACPAPAGHRRAGTAALAERFGSGFIIATLRQARVLARHYHAKLGLVTTLLFYRNCSRLRYDPTRRSGWDTGIVRTSAVAGMTRSFKSIMMRKSVGTKISVKMVETNNPPSKTLPRPR